MAKKVNFIIWCIIASAVAVLTVLRPRVSGAVLLIFCIGMALFIRKKCDIPYTSDDGTTSLTEPRSTKTTLIGVIILPFLLFFGSFLNIICPYHALYEYKHEIAKLKANEGSLYTYSHFPDEIPDGVTHRKWMYYEYLIGCEALSFTADDAYIDRIYAEYSGSAKHYPAEIAPEDVTAGYDAADLKYDSLPPFYAKNFIQKADIDNIDVLMVTENSSGSRTYYSGIIINRETKHVCYFSCT